MAGVSGSDIQVVGDLLARGATALSAQARQQQAQAQAQAEAASVDSRLDAAERTRLDRLRAAKAKAGRGSTVLTTATGLTGDSTGSTLLGG